MKIPLLFALTGTLCAASWAQPPINSTNPAQVGEAQPERKQLFKLTLKNVRPSVMAYWLDPRNHEVPPEFRTQTSNLSSSAFAGIQLPPEAKPELVRLPAGVDRIVAVDPQNALLVFGTAEGAKALEESASFLDRPMRQVELEVRFVSIDRKYIATIAPSISPTNSIQRGNLESALDPLLRSRKAVVITSPRVVALNNLQAEINSEYAEPVQIQSPNNARLQALSAKAEFVLATNFAAQFTPTINNDGTVTVLSHIEQNVQLKNSKGESQGLVLQKWQTPDTIVNVRDGETVALLCSQTPEEENSSKALMVFLTTRIVKRDTAN